MAGIGFTVMALAERSQMSNMVVPSVAVPSRTEAVLDALKHAILTGRLPPGQALVENDLAAQMGVSKTPVREALKTLAGAGLVTMSPYKGATVRTVDDVLAHSVYDIRLLLEPEALRRAVAAAGTNGDGGGGRGRGDSGNGSSNGSGTSVHWQAAADALDRADQCTEGADRSLANRDFHRALYLGCGNELMVGILDGLRDQTALVSAVVWDRNPSWQDEAAEHRAILDAVLAGSAERAASLLHSHIAAFVERNFGKARTG